jgi:hypothetical protein
MRNLGDFIGTYDLTRTIDDRRAGAVSRFEGSATLSVEGARAIYRETGALIMSGQRFEAERAYLWDHVGPMIRVAFDDGRPFHDFDPVRGGLASEHLCGDDIYRGGYDVSDWPNWTVRWDVSGPRKDYTSVTLCTRGLR